MVLSLADYKTYANDLLNGYIKAAYFLVQQSILAPRDMPYTTQLVPLSVLLTILGNRTDDSVVKKNWLLGIGVEYLGKCMVPRRNV